MNTISYQGDGEQTTFEFPFRAFSDGDIKVRLNGVEANTAAYAVSVIGKTVSFVEPPALDTVIEIYRKLDFARLAVFQTGGVFRAEDLNIELEYNRECMKQVATALSGISDMTEQISLVSGQLARMQELANYAEDCANTAENLYNELSELFNGDIIDMGSIE